MIVNSPVPEQIKLIVDEIDLKNNGISIEEIKFNPQKINFLLKELSPDLINYSQIITYNFKVFYITFYLKDNITL